MGCGRGELLVLRRCCVVTSLLTVGLRASLTTVVCAGCTMGLLLVMRRLLVSTAAIITVLSVAVLLSITTLLLVTALLSVSALVVAGAVVSRHDVVYEVMNLDLDN